MWKWLKSIFSSGWMKAILQFILSHLKTVLVQVGKEVYDRVKAKIVEVSGMQITNKEKFDLVFKYAKGLLPEIKDSALNLLIESLVNQLKVRGTL